MKYEEALAEWGARQLENRGAGPIDRSTVEVDLGYEEGYGGCDTCGYGGRDGYSTINISGQTASGYGLQEYCTIDDANMFDVFKGLIEVSGGMLDE